MSHMILLVLFGHAPLGVVVPHISFHTGQFWARSTASFNVRLWVLRSRWMVFNHVMRGHPCLSFVGWHHCYVPDECTPVTATGHRPLRSADNRMCLVKRSHNQFGDCCFATTRTTLLNSLPEQLRQPDITFGQFKRSLKTFMFG